MNIFAPYQDSVAVEDGAGVQMKHSDKVQTEGVQATGGDSSGPNLWENCQPTWLTLTSQHLVFCGEQPPVLIMGQKITQITFMIYLTISELWQQLLQHWDTSHDWTINLV